MTRTIELLDDLAEASVQRFFGIRVGRMLVASAGVECHGSVALLRSVAVLPAYQKQGLARTLVRHAEDYAVGQGATLMYLLTATAKRFFMHVGYAPIPRESAPPAIAAGTQFSTLCPASAALLKKSITSLVQ